MQSVYLSPSKQSPARWLANAILYLGLILLAIILIMMITNLGVFNNLQFPILDILPLFSGMLEQSPWQTLVIFSNKSMLAIGQADMRSGLYLWTFELDINTLLVYCLAAGLAAWLFHALPVSRNENRRLHRWTLAGLVLLVFSRTYITVLAHCAGPTWAGYVSLYAMGMDEVELTPLWQWIMAAIATACLYIPVSKTFTAKKQQFNHPDF